MFRAELSSPPPPPTLSPYLTLNENTRSGAIKFARSREAYVTTSLQQLIADQHPRQCRMRDRKLALVDEIVDLKKNR